MVGSPVGGGWALPRASESVCSVSDSNSMENLLYVLLKYGCFLKAPKGMMADCVLIDCVSDGTKSLFICWYVSKFDPMGNTLLATSMTM